MKRVPQDEQISPDLLSWGQAVRARHAARTRAGNELIDMHHALQESRHRWREQMLAPRTVRLARRLAIPENLPADQQRYVAVMLQAIARHRECIERTRNHLARLRNEQRARPVRFDAWEEDFMPRAG